MVPQERFEDILIPHMKAAFNLAYWILRNRDEAEDVVQDAYVRAFLAYEKTEVRAAKPWLLMIVRNVAYRSLQNRKRSTNVVVLADDVGDGDLHLLDAPDLGPTAESELISKCERQQLLDAVNELPVGYREVIVLRELEGLSYAEIGQTVGVPIGTVMSRLARARMALRSSIIRLERQDENKAV